jgi:uncharacterized delta-60 repeat protein
MTEMNMEGTMTRHIARIAASILFTASSLAASAAALDPTFGTGGKVILDYATKDWPHGVLVQPDGRVVVGNSYGILSLATPSVTRLEPSGQLDASFGTNGHADVNSFNTYVLSVARGPDGSIFAGGRRDWYGVSCVPPVCQPPTSYAFAAKVSASGVPDDTFNTNAQAAIGSDVVSSQGGVAGIDVQGDAKVLVLEDKRIVRLNADGTLDLAIDPVAQGVASFETLGPTILAQADGSIVIGLHDGHQVGFARFAANGTLVSQGLGSWPCSCFSYSPDPPGYPVFTGGFAAQQADGKILVGGSAVSGSGGTTLGIVRFLADGTVDNSYGANGAAVVPVLDAYTMGGIRGLAVGPDGKAVVLLATMDLYRLTTDGQLDTTFAPGGRFTVFISPRQNGRGLAVQGDGKVVVLASTDDPDYVSRPSDAVVARIDPLIAPPVSVSPSPIGFAVQSAFTVSDAVTVTVTNTSGSTTTVDSVTASPGYAASSTCGTLAPGATCTIDVASAPDGSVVGTVVPGALTVTAGGVPVTVALRGYADASFVSHFYRSILHRDYDGAGYLYWTGVANTMGTRYSALQEAWYAMGLQFFGSTEYANQNRTDAQFLDDLYETFFARPGDSDGLAYWQSQLDAGLTREMVLTSFLFSPEFMQMTAKMDQIQAYTQTNRAETNMTLDFYRGILARVPDTAGMDFWLGQMRDAQCAGAGAVDSAADRISQSFLGSAEYAARARTDAQYVGDLYNAFLRRGADAGGFNFWVGQLQSHAQTREQLRQVFLGSPEFSARVDAVIAQGCTPH